MLETQLVQAEKQPKTPHRFQPGNTFGKGRPRGIDAQVRALIKAEGPRNIQVMCEIRDNPKAPANVRLAAATTLQYLGFGKPREMAEEKEGNELARLSASDVDALLG